MPAVQRVVADLEVDVEACGPRPTPQLSSHPPFGNRCVAATMATGRLRLSDLS